MPAARYIGRVGGLAVALGVGSAIVFGGGVANAAPDSSGSTGASRDNQSNTRGAAQRTRPAKAADGKGAAPASVTTDSGSGVKTLPGNDSGASGGSAVTDAGAANHGLIKHQSLRGWSAKHAASATSKPATAVQPATATTPTLPAANPAPPAPPAPPADPAVATVSVNSVAPVPAEVQTAAVSQAPAAASAAATSPVSQLITDLLKPFAGSSPNAPVETPAAWVLLAASRRELGATTRTASPTSLTAVPVAASTESVTPLIAGPSDPVLTDGILNGQVTTSLTGDLRYTVVSGPTGGGKVNLGTTGAYTYLPYLTDVTAGNTEKFSVLVAQHTGFDTFLESIPLLGSSVPQLLVSLYQMPVLNTLLAPLIGSAAVVPVNVNLATLVPTGAPVAYTYKVASVVDGTLISTNFFPAHNLAVGTTAPTIMAGPGLATAGDTNPYSQGPTGVGMLRSNGYNVVTWDPRGEFDSGGVLQLDNPNYEGKDVSSIITWMAGQPGVQVDDVATHDPRMGMVGGSYGGGIQWVSAANDPRIDAIVPTIAWNTLNQSLYPGGAFKTSWASLLLLGLVETGSRINPELYSGILSGALFGTLSQAQQDLLTSSGPGTSVNDIHAPTLMIQGTVDDLFPLQQALVNAGLLADNVDANGDPLPVKMIWYCGGHGVCLNPASPIQTQLLVNDTVDWLDRYVKGDVLVDTGPVFQWVDQTGNYYASNKLPTEASFYGTPISDTGTGGFLPIIPIVGGSGPSGLVSLPYSLPIPTKASNAINIPLALPSTGTTQLVGAPSVSFTYSGLGTARYIYAQIVDNATGRVVGNVVTPIAVTLDGKSHPASVTLEDIAYTATPGSSLTLQLVASTTAYQSFTSLGYINVSGVGVTLPTVGAGADVQPVTSAAAVAV